MSRRLLFGASFLIVPELAGRPEWRGLWVLLLVAGSRSWKRLEFTDDADMTDVALHSSSDSYGETPRGFRWEAEDVEILGRDHLPFLIEQLYTEVDTAVRELRQVLDAALYLERGDTEES